MKNRPEDAGAAFQRVVRIDPNDAGTNVNLGQLHAQQRKYREAIAALRMALAGEPYMSSVGCLDCVVVNLLLMHGCGRSVGPLCNFDCEHKNRRQPFRLGRFLRR